MIERSVCCIPCGLDQPFDEHILPCKPQARTVSWQAANLACIHTLVIAADRQCISTEKAPGAVGPYSQAVKTGNMLFVSGQVGLIPGVSENLGVTCVCQRVVHTHENWLFVQTKNFAGGEDVEAQTEQVMQNMGAILEAGGSSFSQVIKTTVLLADMGDFQKVNAVYGASFLLCKPAKAIGCASRGLAAPLKLS